FVTGVVFPVPVALVVGLVCALGPVVVVSRVMMVLAHAPLPSPTSLGDALPVPQGPWGPDPRPPRRPAGPAPRRLPRAAAGRSRSRLAPRAPRGRGRSRRWRRRDRAPRRAPAA